MAYMKIEVTERIVQQLEDLRHDANVKVRLNKYSIKELVREQALLKRSAKKYSELIYSMENKKKN